MKTTDRRLPIDAIQPAREPLAEASRVISSGRLVVFPTSGLYGLAADAFDAAAVDRVFTAKGRSPDNPVLILIRHPADLAPLVAAVPPAAVRLMEKLWPGGLTLIFPAAPVVPATLTAGTGKIGIRLPVHPVARALVEMVGRPITGTSANVSGRPGCAAIQSLDTRIAAAAELILDAGPLTGGAGSTIVDVTGDRPVILRHGAVPDDLIERALAPD